MWNAAFMIWLIERPKPKGSCSFACTVCVYAIGDHGASSVNVSAMSSIVIALIGPIGPSLRGFLNGTLSESELIPCESHEIVSPDACFADTPFATTAEVSPLR